MKSYSQRDPAWSNMLLGASTLSLGRYGCTTSGIADLSTYFGDNFDPGQASKKIKYTQPTPQDSGGLVIWNSCNFEHFQFWFREKGRNDVNIKNALANPNLAVLLNVAKGSHWVVATGKPLFGNAYKIADPWLGDFATMSRYGNDITGAAYFKRV